MKTITVLGAALTAVLVTSSGAQGATASTSSEDSPRVAFSYFSSDSYEQVYDSIVEVNGAEVAASYFNAAASVDGQPVQLPGMEDLTADERREVLLNSANAATTGIDLVPDTGPDAGSLRTPNPNHTYYLDGEAINNDYSWQYKGRTTVTECGLFNCDPKGWLEYRLVTDPGETGTRTSLQFTTFGALNFVVTLNSDVWSSGGGYISAVTNNWNVPGNGTQWNTPHESLDGKNFTGFYLLEVSYPYFGSSQTDRMAWRTGTTLPCGDADGTAAFRCHF